MPPWAHKLVCTQSVLSSRIKQLTGTMSMLGLEVSKSRPVVAVTFLFAFLWPDIKRVIDVLGIGTPEATAASLRTTTGKRAQVICGNQVGDP